MRNGRRQRWRERRSKRKPARTLASASGVFFALVALNACAPRVSPELRDAHIQKLLSAGDSGEALRAADQALRSISRAGNTHAYWSLYLTKAEAVLKSAGPQQAADMLAAAEIPESPEFADLLARKKLIQAKAKFRLNDYKGAVPLLAEATKLAEQAQATGLGAVIETWKCSVFARLGDWADSEQAARDGYQLASRTGEEWRIGQALGALGFVRLSQSRFEDALRYFERQVPLIPTDDLSSRAGALNNTAVCHYKLGELDEALKAYKEAIAINVATGHADEESVCLGNMGNVYLDRGQYVEAQKCFVRAIGLNRGNQGDMGKWFSNLARAAIEMKDWEAAENFNKKALAIKRGLKDRTGELYSLRNAALIAQGKGNAAESESLFSEVIEAESDDPTPALESQAGLAKLYAATGRPDQAEARFRAALNMVERSRSLLVKDSYKLSFLESLIAFQQDYVEFLMSQSKPERALEIAEASRARILCERLGVNQATAKFTSDQYRRLAGHERSVLLSYWTAPRKSYLWVITAGDIKAFTLPDQAVIQSLVERHRALIENLKNPLEIENSTSNDLYRALIQPFREQIPKDAHIVIVPDGPLYSLNFETLPAAESSKQFLIADATITVSPALNLMASRSEHRIGNDAGSRSLLLIGDPDSTDPMFPKLPYAGEEIASVERHFQKPLIHEFRSSAAIPAAYQKAAAGSYSYVHFTAHAIADREHPLDSAIILTGPAEAGRLTAKSVLGQPLDAGLVTLSACHTAGARTYAGEGMVGFTWAFFQVGARSVIAGLWDVSDESTPRLMDDVYSGMTAGKAPAEALREAKLNLIRSKTNYSRPYFWGPFQLYVRTALQ